eukprot:TRINITY_DN33358_c0_g2_i1.p1 TRINITY_DN33358_c0_g2~~TRINITY_DN33358_c0_g2_i1.p1  ORF type:complete len:644 (+),score=105.65 TRINITY_DN33358_c0_g2_i1:30-1934(+)
MASSFGVAPQAFVAKWHGGLPSAVLTQPHLSASAAESVARASHAHVGAVAAVGQAPGHNVPQRPELGTGTGGRHSTFVASAAAAVAAVAAIVGNSRHNPRRQRRRPAGLGPQTALVASRQVVALQAEREDGGGAEGHAEAVDVVVVGAGVSGLCAAHGLLKEQTGKSVIVTEARDRVGGNVSTRTGDGRLWEEGPNSFMPGDDILTVACDVGLQEDIMLADPDSYRFVWWEGKLRALPATPFDAVFGDFLSLPGKIRAGLGLIGIKDPMPNREETIAEFVSRNLGTEAFERLIDPFVSGVFAGDPTRLSAEAATGRVQVLEKTGGSLLAGAVQLIFERLKGKATEPPRDPRLPEVKGQTVGSFRGGLKQFVDAVADDVARSGSPVRLHWKLQRLQWDQKRQEHILEYDTPEGPAKLRSRAVVMTAPSHVTAEMLRPLSSSAAAALEEIVYPRVAAVTVEYPKASFREPEHGRGPVNGFGQLHPRTQGIRTLGTIYSSSLFENRMPDKDKVMLLHYIGGMQDPKLFGGIEHLTDDELVEATHIDAVQTLLKNSATHELPRALGVRVWPRAIPQAELGHSARLEQAQNGLEEAGVRGMFLAGNYVGGVALGRCVEYGLEIAREASKFVDSKGGRRG